MTVISILNYGSGNIGAIPNMLKKCGASSRIVSDPAELEMADKILLPGVGAFGRAMENLRGKGFVEMLTKKTLVDKVPTLGICLGMQLLSNGSEENLGVEGLGWIPGKVCKFRFADRKLKIPHMGWNTIKIRRESPLLKELDGARFYHVHSYHYVLDDPEHELASTFYGYDFPSVINKDNIYGAQFHPEKSHRFGLQLLKNFAEI